jgi:plastocyanin
MNALAGAGFRAPVLASLCALLLAVLALGVGTGWSGHGSRATAADCAWTRHAKRVVKHVHRDGRPRRVVRVKHFWRCDTAPAVPIASPPPAAPVPSPSPPAPGPEANRVGVSAHDQGGDFGFVLTRPQVRAGRVTVELNNQGEDPHNLNLERDSGGAEPVYELSNALPSQQQVASFELPAGTYRLWCSLPEHDEKGMHSTLVVE